MKVTIDRFEGGYAVCEQVDRIMINIARVKIPADAKEGDILKIEGEKINIDAGETTRRQKRIQSQMNDLWK